MLVAIAACEIGFWVVLVSGLLARHVGGKRRLSAALLLAVPLVDVALLVFTVVDLRRGTLPNGTHSLAAVYLGFSIAFGHDLVRRADREVAQRVGSAAPPAPPPARGTVERARLEWHQWRRAAGGYVVTAVLIVVMAALVGFRHGAGVLFSPLVGLGIALAVWLVGWPVLCSAQASRDRRRSDVNRALP